MTLAKCLEATVREEIGSASASSVFWKPTLNGLRGDCTRFRIFEHMLGPVSSAKRLKTGISTQTSNMFSKQKSEEEP